MEFEVKIDSKKERGELFVTLSIDGEVGVGRKRLRWIHGGKLVKKLGRYLYSDVYEPFVFCEQLFKDLAEYADLAKYAKQFDRPGKKRSNRSARKRNRDIPSLRKQ